MNPLNLVVQKICKSVFDFYCPYPFFSNRAAYQGSYHNLLFDFSYDGHSTNLLRHLSKKYFKSLFFNNKVS